MQSKQMFQELVFYMEACESGSMFPDLTKDGKIFAVTAANAQESSWGFYCGPGDLVRGKNLGTCLGDLFSISWMEDSDLGLWSAETIKQQVQKVTTRTSKSHVMTFGDLSLESQTIGRVEMTEALGTSAEAMQKGKAYDVRDIPLHTAYWRWARAEAQEKAREYDAMQRVVTNRAADEALFGTLAQRACGALPGCSSMMASGKSELTDYECHKVLSSTIQESCPRREKHNAGGWNGFNMKFSQVLVNLCESRALLRKDTQDLAQLVHGECTAASLAAAPVQALVI